MKRSLRNHVVVGFVCGFAVALPANTRGQSPGRIRPDGGIRRGPSAPGWRLRRQGRRSRRAWAATNAGLRVLKYVGGSVPDVLACVNYVKSCRDAGGGFARDARRQARRGHHRHRPDGRLRAEDRRPEMIQRGDRLPWQECQELRGNPDGRRRARGRAAQLARLPRVVSTRSRRCGTRTAPSATGPASRLPPAARPRRSCAWVDRSRSATRSSRPSRPASVPTAAWSKDDGLPTSRAPTGSCGRSTCSTRGPISTGCSASSPAAASPTAAMPALRAARATSAATYYGHDPDPLGAAARGPARRRRDGRLHAAGQRRRSRRLGRRHASSGRPGTACSSATLRV